MPAATIVAPKTLAKELGDPNWLVLDARFSLDDEVWGRREHAETHIPGALYADLATDLAGEIIPGKTGRRPLPDFQTWRKTLSHWGVNPNTQLVVYDSAGGMMAAARVWWMLRWAGHDAVAVLDGGLPAWLREGRPVDQTVAARIPSSFEGREQDNLLADLDLVDKRRRDPA
jgi:thiosulfate/3-mercaptopyruvate sulfurtransferase